MWAGEPSWWGVVGHRCQYGWVRIDFLNGRKKIFFWIFFFVLSFANSFLAGPKTRPRWPSGERFRTGPALYGALKWPSGRPQVTAGEPAPLSRWPFPVSGRCLEAVPETHPGDHFCSGPCTGGIGGWSGCGLGGGLASLGTTPSPGSVGMTCRFT